MTTNHMINKLIANIFLINVCLHFSEYLWYEKSDVFCG